MVDDRGPRVMSRNAGKTKREAIKFVRSCDENGGPETKREAAEIFEALYGRTPDAEDEAAGVWSLCCAAVAS